MDNSSKVEMDYKQDSHYEEIVMMKSPKTYEEQVKIIKRKGFIVDDDEACESFLNRQIIIVYRHIFCHLEMQMEHILKILISTELNAYMSLMVV